MKLLVRAFALSKWSSLKWSARALTHTPRRDPPLGQSASLGAQHKPGCVAEVGVMQRSLPTRSRLSELTATPPSNDRMYNITYL